MSDTNELAKEATSLCIAVMSLSWSPAAIGAIAIPLISLTGLGHRLWAQCPQRVTTAAIKDVLAGMEQAQIPAAQIQQARDALHSLPAAATLSPTALADAAKSDRGFDAAIIKTLLGHLPDATKVDARSLIEAALSAGLRACRQHPEFRTALTESLLLDTAKSLGLVQSGIERVESTITENTAVTLDIKSDMERLLAGLQGASRPELDTLAARFGHPDAPNASLPELKAFLHDKAQDLARLGHEIAALKGLSPRIDNIRSAAEEAVKEMRLDEARSLLTEAREIQKDLLRAPLEANAALLERLAQIDLIEGKTQEAFTHLSAAADSFAGIDPLEPAQRRILHYFGRLREHGLRYGGTGLARALDLLVPAVTDVVRARDAWLWAAGMNARANALSDQGTRTGGAEGAAQLAQAVEAYRAALEVHTRDAHPVHWAMTQNNLANALRNQATRTGGVEGAALRAQAVEAYRAALEVRTRDAHPVDWAMTQNNLGVALREQGTRTDGAGGTDLLAQAVEAYRAALKVTTRDEHPVDWAGTQNNLGTALSEQGTRTGGGEGATLLAQAVEAYRAALEIYTRDAHPVQWATTQNNLGTALSEQGTRTGGGEGATLLAKAVTAFRAALEIHTRDAQPVSWAITQENLGEAHLSISAHETCTAPQPALTAALAHVEAALTVYDPVHMPYDHGTASALRERILKALAP